MTNLQLPPGRLLTIADYLALGETEQFRTEQQEGNLVISPNPGALHQFALAELVSSATRTAVLSPTGSRRASRSR